MHVMKRDRCFKQSRVKRRRLPPARRSTVSLWSRSVFDLCLLLTSRQSSVSRDPKLPVDARHGRLEPGSGSLSLNTRIALGQTCLGFRRWFIAPASSRIFEIAKKV